MSLWLHLLHDHREIRPFTERADELSVDDDVSVSPDGGGEVGVARNVESVVFELRLFLNGPGAEIAGQLQLHKMWVTFRE